MSEAGDFLSEFSKQWKREQAGDAEHLRAHGKVLKLEHWAVVGHAGPFPDPKRTQIWELEQTFIAWEHTPRGNKGLHLLLWMPPLRPGDVGRIIFQPDTTFTFEQLPNTPAKTITGVAPLFKEVTLELAQVQSWLEDLMWSEWMRRTGKS